MSQRARSVVGQVLGGSYRVERLLGVGSVGAVYVARHVRTGALCAVKMLHRKLRPGTEALARFQEEAKILAALRHPHIVSFSDFELKESETPYLVMELLEGENLAQRLRQRGSLSLSQTVEIIKQVGSALQAAHRSGVLHRNLKPENIFLTRHDLGDRVLESAKVTDFGLSRLRRAAGPIVSSGTSTGNADPSVLGLSQFTAPEMIMEPTAPSAQSAPAAPAAMDGRVDQWALAVLLYRMLSGRLPYEGENLREVLRLIAEGPQPGSEGGQPIPLQQLAPELPPSVVEAISKGMSRRREDRFDSVMDLVRALSEQQVPLVSLPPKQHLVVPSSSPALQSGDVEITRKETQASPQPILAPSQGSTGIRRQRRHLYLAAGFLLMVAGTTVLLMQSGREEGLALSGAPKELSLKTPQPIPEPPPAPTPAVEPPPAALTPLAAVSDVQAQIPKPATPRQVQLAGTPDVEVKSKGTPEKIPSVPTEEKAPSDPAPTLVPLAQTTGNQGDKDLGNAPEAEQLLRQAQQTFTEGDHQKAIALALSITAKGASHGAAYVTAAWRFLGLSACRIGDPKLATKAHKHLGNADRQFMDGVCQRQGLALVDGEYRMDTWPAAP